MLSIFAVLRRLALKPLPVSTYFIVCFVVFLLFYYSTLIIFPMGRVNIIDYMKIWLVFLFIFWLTTGLAKFSIVLSLLAIINVFVLVFLFSCTPTDKPQARAFFDGLIVVGHRGLSDDAPENTLAAIRLSKELGANGVEFDVELTKDGIPILMHDDTVDRTTDSSGSLSMFTWEQVKKLNAAAKFSDQDRYEYESVPSVEQAVELCVQLGLKIIFDVKHGDPRILTVLLKLFMKHKILYNNAIVCSFYPRLLYELKRSDSSIMTGHTWRPWVYTCADVNSTVNRFPDKPWRHMLVVIGDIVNVWWLHNWLWKFSGAVFVLTERQSISKEYIKMWYNRGLYVGSWTVNDRYEKIYYKNTLMIPYLTDRLSDIQD